MTRVPSAFAAAALLVAAVPAMADDPGPGGRGRKVGADTGQQVYRDVCQACHMPDGKGAVGAGRIPALAGNPALAAADYPIVTILNGRGAMPSFRGSLDRRQIAAVVAYVRTHFGNGFREPVTEADVARDEAMAAN